MGANELLGSVLDTLLPDAPWAQLLIEHALIVGTALVVAVALLLLLVALFFDFITDVWKIPFGVGVDALKYYGLFNPWAALVAGAGSIVIFLWLSDAKLMKYPFAALGAAAGLLVWWWNPLVIGALLALLPVNTVLMFLSTIVD